VRRRAERRIKQSNPLDSVAIDVAANNWVDWRRKYRFLLRWKREEFWRTKVTSECSSLHQLWRSVDTLLGRGRVPTSLSISADTMHTFFDTNVTGVRASTKDSTPPTYNDVPPGHPLTDFMQLPIDDVIAAV
jgi:hypothetical protein